MAKEKAKKSVFKRIMMGFGVVISLIILGVVVAAVTDSSNVGGSESVTITLAEFKNVTDGMSYDEVQAVVGGEGTVVSESGKEGASDHTVMYEYKGDGISGANASFMFQGGKMITKAQAGLK